MKFGGGSIMVWEYFSAKGTGNISVIDDRTNTAVYKNILGANLMISFESLELFPGLIFQQDNGLKNNAKYTKKWLVENKLNISKWPSHCSDLNPIKNLWCHLKIHIKLRTSTNTPDLKTICDEEWNEIPTKICKSLIDD